MRTRALRFATAVLTIAGILSLQDCAYFLQKYAQNVPVTCAPAGARISVDGREVGRAPLVLTLKKNRKHTVRIEMEGYDPAEVVMTRNITPRMLLSLLYIPVMAAGGLMGSFLYVLATDPEGDWDSKERLMTTVTLISGALGAAALIGDISSGANYSIAPKTIDVALRKASETGPPRVQRIFLDAGSADGIRWIRIGAAGPDGGRADPGARGKRP